MFIQSMKTAYNSLTDLSIQYRVILNDKIQWRWLRAAADKNDTGNVIWYGSSQDITPLIDYIDVLEQIIFDISHVIRRPVTTIIGLCDLIKNTNSNEEDIREIANQFKIVASEMDNYTKFLNISYNEKKMNTTEYESRFQFLNKRIDLFEKPTLKPYNHKD
jgi:signal transduction histidine kinase